MQRRLLFTFFFALSFALVPLAKAEEGFANRDIDLRAGPSPDYPVVAFISSGTTLDVQGCLADYSWCDVIAQGERGWVYAADIEYVYAGSPVPLIEYAPAIGVTVVPFYIDDYWDRWYRGRPWYWRRDEWRHRPMPPHAPPPMVAPKPPSQPAPPPQGRPPGWVPAPRPVQPSPRELPQPPVIRPTPQMPQPGLPRTDVEPGVPAPGVPRSDVRPGVPAPGVPRSDVRPGVPAPGVPRAAPTVPKPTAPAQPPAAREPGQVPAPRAVQPGPGRPPVAQ